MIRNSHITTNESCHCTTLNNNNDHDDDDDLNETQNLTYSGTITTRKLMLNEGSTAHKTKMDGFVSSFVRPWMSIVLLSLIAATYNTVFVEQQQQHQQQYRQQQFVSPQHQHYYQQQQQQTRTDLLVNPFEYFFLLSSSSLLTSQNEVVTHQSMNEERFLIETDDYEPELPHPSHSHHSDHSDNSDHSDHHSHKPVYSEEHKALFPLNIIDWYGFGLAVIGLMIAAGGGVGGGGILVPIYILVLGFSPKHAIPLSNITVLGGAAANTLLNWWKRHPSADRPLIDWDLILVMEPFTVAGALIGAILNKILPELLLSVLLVVLLSFTGYTSLQKAVKMYKKETADILAANRSQLTKLDHQQDFSNHSEAGMALLTNKNLEMETSLEHDIVVGGQRPPLLRSEAERLRSTITRGMEMEESSELDTVGSGPRPPLTRSDAEGLRLLYDDPYESIEVMKRRKQDLATILDEERRVPMTNVVILVIMFAVVLTVNILKGGGQSFPSPIGIKCGSKEFWFANLFLLLWITATAIFVRQYLVQRYYRKINCNYQYAEGDIKWDERTTITYPAICCFAGFFAGMFGIGGGIVKGPLLLAMGVHPAVGAASTAAMILFTAFAATSSFVVFGLLIPDYALLLGLIGFVATLVGQIGLTALMKKSKRNSYIAFSIGGVVTLSAFLMTIQSMLSMAVGEKHHTGGICGKDD